MWKLVYLIITAFNITCIVSWQYYNRWQLELVQVFYMLFVVILLEFAQTRLLKLKIPFRNCLVSFFSLRRPMTLSRQWLIICQMFRVEEHTSWALNGVSCSGTSNNFGCPLICWSYPLILLNHFRVLYVEHYNIFIAWFDLSWHYQLIVALASYKKLKRKLSINLIQYFWW